VDDVILGQIVQQGGLQLRVVVAVVHHAGAGEEVDELATVFVGQACAARMREDGRESCARNRALPIRAD
jgi:hypothetical protein